MIADILHRVKEFESEESWPYSPRPSLSGPQRCRRFLDYYRQGYDKKPFPGRFMVVLEDSSIHELLIKDLIQKSAFQVHSEQMEIICGSVNGHQIKGHIDGLVTDILGIDRLLEIKALSHFGFQDIWAGELPIDYIYQTCLYARGLHEINPDIREALLLIKNKNQAQFCEIALDYNNDADSCLIKEMVLSTGEKKEINQTIENVVGGAIAKFEEVELFAQEKKIHDRQYERDNWHCQYCPFGELCWENWEFEFEQRLEEGALPDEFQDTMAYYLECSMHETEMKKEKESLRDKILNEMKRLNIKKAKAGPYVAIIRLQNYTSINKESPENLRKLCTKITTSEVLNIRKPKQG